MANENVAKKMNLGMVMAIYLFGIFMGAIDTGIVTPARTIIQNNLAVDEKTGIWMITIYTLAYAASIPVMGKLADKFGRKYIYLTSIFLFGLGSLFCGLSQDFGSFWLLLAARVVQAIGGGGIMPVATAEFGTTFPIEKRGMALGLVGGVYGIANIFGSSAGSAILDIFGKNNWQFIFYINIPITIFVLAAGLIFLPNTKMTNVKKIDKIGILLVVVIVLSLLYGLRNIDFFNFFDTITSTKVYPYLIAFVVLLPIFILAEKRAEDPVMNLEYFTNPKIVITLIVGFIVGFVMMGMIFVPQFSENALKIASGSGGYFVIILGVFTGVSAPLSGKLVDKIGAKKVLLIGFVTTIIGSLFLILITVKHPAILTVGISLLLIGLGLGFIMGAPLNYMMLENTKKEESNSALATLSLVRSIGTTIAPAIMIGFLAHAGGAVQDNVMTILPAEIDAVKLPYAQELTEKLNKLKTDPNLKDKLSQIEIPDLSAKTKIDINGNGNTTLPADLLELMKTSDVTNITGRTKILASRMFGDKTPKIIADIQAGVQKGIEGMSSGLTDMEKNVQDLKKGYDGISTAIKGMQNGADGLEKAISQMNSAITQQKAALKQMNMLYAQMSSMPSTEGAPTTGTQTTGMPATGIQASGMPTTGTQSSGMPTTGTQSSGMPTTGVQTSGMPAAGVKPIGSGSSINLIDMIPALVKAKIPKSVLEQLKNVKTPADLKAKINELQKAVNTLENKVSDLEKQREELIAKISEAKNNQKDMNKAIISINAAEIDIKDTIEKMTALHNAVPEAFNQSEKNYLKEIDKLSPKIEAAFQNTLNNGFKQVYMAAMIAALLAMMILIIGGKGKGTHLSYYSSY